MKAPTFLLVLLLSSLTSASRLPPLVGAEKVLGPSFSDDLKVPGNNPLAYCSAEYPRNILTIDYVNIIPNPPVPGNNVTITFSGSLSAPIENGAYAKVEVRFRNFKLLSKTVDLCAQAGRVDRGCPIEKGPQTANKMFEVPTGVPPGKYEVVGDAYTKDGKRITCLTAEMEVKALGEM